VDFANYGAAFVASSDFHKASDTPFIPDFVAHVGCDHTEAVLDSRELADQDLQRNSQRFQTNSKMSQENRRERTPVRSRKRTAIPTIGSGDTKRDLTVSSFMLALVLVGVVVAAHTNHPVFWLLIGPTPFARSCSANGIDDIRKLF